MPSKSKKNTGFQSAAGLIRYFDNEVDKGPVFKPWYVVVGIIVLVAIVSIAKVIWPV
jgi:preprotein translocase subunit Sec61beta